MLDDIGLGNAMENLIYFIIFVLGFFGIRFFLKRKNIPGIIFWIASVLNLFFYLYFMGNYRLYPKIFYPIVNNYWPLVNLGLLILLVMNYIRKKKATSSKK